LLVVAVFVAALVPALAACRQIEGKGVNRRLEEQKISEALFISCSSDLL
jgi:hypothetical protein